MGNGGLLAPLTYQLNPNQLKLFDQKLVIYQNNLRLFEKNSTSPCWREVAGVKRRLTMQIRLVFSVPLPGAWSSAGGTATQATHTAPLAAA